jgi:integrase/recombinase XerD
LFTAENSLKVAPIEVLLVPRELDGSRGTNRELNVIKQIAADTDVEAIRVWLSNFVMTKTTFDTYRKEAERLLL